MIICTFNKTRDAIQAEKICKRESVEYRIIPVPRSISANCGMAIEVEKGKKDVLMSGLESKGISAQTYDKADVKQ